MGEDAGIGLVVISVDAEREGGFSDVRAAHRESRSSRRVSRDFGGAWPSYASDGKPAYTQASRASYEEQVRV